MPSNASVDFFDRQFQQQLARSEHALNPFEAAAFERAQGRLLDFGCGLGNLALAAARRGQPVLALDASPTAIVHLQQVARDEGLPLQARQADLREPIELDGFDTVVSIGLLMFFDCATAHSRLDWLLAQVRPGGIVALNVLVTGTTYLDMFAPAGHCLFDRRALQTRVAGWELLLDRHDEFAAPGNTVKAFSTVIARRPPSA